MQKAQNSHELFNIKQRYNKKLGRFKSNLRELRDRIKIRLKEYRNSETDIVEVRRVFLDEYNNYIEKQKNLQGQHRWTKIRMDLVLQILQERLDAEIE